MEEQNVGQGPAEPEKDTSAAQPTPAAPESAQPATPAPDEAERASGQPEDDANDNPETDTDGEADGNDGGSPEEPEAE